MFSSTSWPPLFVLLGLSLLLGIAIAYVLSKRNYANLKSITSLITAAKQGKPLPPPLREGRVTDEYSFILQNMIKTFLEQNYLKTQLSEHTYRLRYMEMLALQALRGRLEAQDEDAAAAIAERGQHIGLANTHKRLRRMYGAAAGVRILSKYGTGTIVALRIPLREEGEEDNELRSIGLIKDQAQTGKAREQAPGPLLSLQPPLRQAFSWPIKAHTAGRSR
ncbi:hypothetical protein IDH44_25330 [Paenibacillus sp. IB182496]|uniref:Uncharacterized protein n=1 Tax=Paenibacillus sabuli TaxID=2772509 RepID=A0A927BX61_9BACL|nr:hypothetical protein [Paenibacillus sabuli]MBD2848516.1 hypothetical protein [Paenibacillus sabuli]